MKRHLLWCGVALLTLAPVQAQQQAPPAPKVLLDAWDAVYLDGAKMGHQRTTVEQLERDGQKVFHTTKLMHLTLKRYDKVVTQRMAMTTDETPDGKVIGVSMTHYLDQGRKVVQSGRPTRMAVPCRGRKALSVFTVRKCCLRRTRSRRAIAFVFSIINCRS
jgi:hypothetical protein